jgi:hypothetical protein
MLIKEAKKITGGLSKPSKMPGPAYNLPGPSWSRSLEASALAVMP